VASAHSGSDLKSAAPAPSASTGVEIGVVVCTFNRATRLRFALESLRTQSLPPSRFAVTLVDDGSNDDTPAVSAEYKSRLTNLTVLRQDNRGLGAAREAGWRSCPAPLIGFLDDDAIAPPNWLEKLLAIFAQAAPSIACVGGPVEGDWEVPPPPWLDADLARWLTVWTLGTKPVTSRDDMLFAGANMTIRRQALEAVGGFDQTLGRKGLSLLSHEESELWQRLRLAGWLSHFAPDLPVRHFVPAARLRPSWFRRRLFWEGISVARRETKPTSSPRWWRAAKLSLRALVSHQVRSHLLQPRQWRRSIHWQCHVAFKLGYARGMLTR